MNVEDRRGISGTGRHTIFSSLASARGESFLLEGLNLAVAVVDIGEWLERKGDLPCDDPMLVLSSC
jgi:hypothetical protein